MPGTVLARQPRAVALRLGLSDGSMTEVLGGDLKEGQTVLIGTAGAPSGGAARASKGPPGLPIAP